MDFTSGYPVEQSLGGKQRHLGVVRELGHTVTVKHIIPDTIIPKTLTDSLKAHELDLIAQRVADSPSDERPTASVLKITYPHHLSLLNRTHTHRSIPYHYIRRTYGKVYP